MGKVISKDGTAIAFDKSGEGSPRWRSSSPTEEEKLL
jgi:hypothetical protein